MLVWVGGLLMAASPGDAQQLPEQVARIGYADSVLINGKIVSMDDATTSSEPGRIYEAMAVKGETIMKLGTTAEVRALAGSFTRVYDLQGRTVIPGIIESHQHIYSRRPRRFDRRQPRRSKRRRRFCVRPLPRRSRT
jgi:adenine deaminase